MAGSSAATPKLVVSGEFNQKPLSGPSSSEQFQKKTISAAVASSNQKKLTKILSTQTSFERHPQYPISKRFSIDADPSCVILNQQSSSDTSNHTSTSLSQTHNNHHSFEQQQSDEQHQKTGDKSPTGTRSPIRSPSFMKKSDSFLEIPYEKGEIVDLIKLADDPNAISHLTDDGQEVLIEHGTTN
ncbi:unnamed protein product [Didymodactylos carnosus]|uniref:Uncharacterized protein n=1 Tax=Didymodactylos carnosus TaxID=1234261 RepID=A0A814BDY6_9BILA|nr:unnamed protein product [Didymodactylos carnosus]CAF1289591.1 unnamed protein product [Didymodactylos carnosus]CAF3706302.1 unnamed protein product [Didymodactylos carnosus]CAF4094425.1 unnamed protein product [Didymodactylos carnosus]